MLINNLRGGRIKLFIYYDIIITIISVSIFLLSFFLINDMNESKTKDIIFFSKIVYGILSFPWLIFSLPFMTILLTKARPTAYDSFGNCVPINKKIRIKNKEKEDNLNENNNLDIMEIFNDKEI